MRVWKVGKEAAPTFAEVVAEERVICGLRMCKLARYSRVSVEGSPIRIADVVRLS